MDTLTDGLVCPPAICGNEDVIVVDHAGKNGHVPNELPTKPKIHQNTKPVATKQKKASKGTKTKKHAYNAQVSKPAMANPEKSYLQVPPKQTTGILKQNVNNTPVVNNVEYPQEKINTPINPYNNGNAYHQPQQQQQYYNNEAPYENNVPIQQQNYQQAPPPSNEIPMFFRMAGGLVNMLGKAKNMFVPPANWDNSAPPINMQSQPQQQQQMPTPVTEPVNLPPIHPNTGSGQFQNVNMIPNQHQQYNPTIPQQQWQNTTNQFQQVGQQPAMFSPNMHMAYGQPPGTPYAGYNMPSLQDIGFGAVSEPGEPGQAHTVVQNNSWYDILLSGPALLFALSVGILAVTSVHEPSINDGLVDHLSHSVSSLVRSGALLTLLVSSIVLLFKSSFPAMPSFKLKRNTEGAIPIAGQALTPEDLMEPQFLSDQPMNEMQVRELIESYLSQPPEHMQQMPPPPQMIPQMLQEQPDMMRNSMPTFDQSYPPVMVPPPFQMAPPPPMPMPPRSSPVLPQMAQVLPQMIPQIYPQVNFASPMPPPPMQIPTSPINPSTQPSFSKPTMQEFLAKMTEMSGEYKNVYGDEDSGDEEEIDIIPAGSLVEDEKKKKVSKRNLKDMHVLDLIQDSKFREEILQEEEAMGNGSYLDAPPLPNIDDPNMNRTIKGNYSAYVPSESVLDKISKTKPLVGYDVKDASSGKLKQKKTINNTNLAVNWNEPVGKKQKEATKIKKVEASSTIVKGAKDQRIKEASNKNNPENFYVDDYACKPYGPPPNRYQGVVI